LPVFGSGFASTYSNPKVFMTWLAGTLSVERWGELGPKMEMGK